MYFVKVEIRPEGKKLPKKQYCMFQYFEISVSVYTSSALPVEVASVSVEKHKNFEFSFVHICKYIKVPQAKCLFSFNAGSLQ